VSAPAVIIRLELEKAPAIYHDCAREGDYARLIDWLRAHPAQADLVARALELARLERAA
jgi:hypothetical protein